MEPFGTAAPGFNTGSLFASVSGSFGKGERHKCVPGALAQHQADDETDEHGETQVTPSTDHNYGEERS